MAIYAMDATGYAVATTHAASHGFEASFGRNGGYLGGLRIGDGEKKVKTNYLEIRMYCIINDRICCL